MARQRHVVQEMLGEQLLAGVGLETDEAGAPDSVSLMSPSASSAKRRSCSVLGDREQIVDLHVQVAASSGRSARPSMRRRAATASIRPAIMLGDTAAAARRDAGTEEMAPARLARRRAPSSARRCRRRAGGTAGSSRLRGCGRSTVISAATRRRDWSRTTRMRSDISTASSILCVTSGDRRDRQAPLDPQIEQVGAQGLGGQHVERRERLVHQQHRRMHHQRAREADPLAHAARQLLRIGALEAVEADQVDGRQRALRCRSAGATPCASRPISTFCSTVSQGNSAKVWNTIATSARGPDDGLARDQTPRRSVAGIRPAMMRSSVDLPQPERPSNETISFSPRCQVDIVEDQQALAAALGIDLADAGRPRPASCPARGS